MFIILRDIFYETCIVSTQVGESVVAKWVYRNFSIMFPNKVSYVDLLELDILDFDVILGMDCLHAYFSSICCMTRMVSFSFPNEHYVE